MGISETKKQIVIDNYLKEECDVNTSLKKHLQEDSRLGLKKAPNKTQQKYEDIVTEYTDCEPDDEFIDSTPSINPQERYCDRNICVSNEYNGVGCQECEVTKSGDTISRKSIKQKLQAHHDFFVNAYGGFSNLPQNDKARVDEITHCIAMVVNEPPVNLQPPKIGCWIHREDMDYLDKNKVVHNHFMCQDCGFIHDFIDGHTSQYNYCPSCGAKMAGHMKEGE